MEKQYAILQLLEKILIHAIHTDDGKLDSKLVAKTRSMQTTWFLTTKKLLKKLEQPVIKLTLTNKNSLAEMDVVKEKGKLLNRLIQTFTTSEGIVKSALPFKLSLTTSFFWKENYDSLVECLTRLEPYLFELEITYPVDGGTLPVNFRNLDLPSLRKLSFQFSGKKVVEENAVATITFGNNSRGMWLLQSISNATKNLKTLKLPFTQFVIPQDLEFLWLPSTIENLDLNLPLKSNVLKFVLRNDFPNLKFLTLLLPDNTLEDNLLHNILERVQNTLTTFCVEGLESAGNPRAHTHLQFPAMEHLQKVIISSVECELGPGEVSDLQECLPNLKMLILLYQSEMNFKKWIHKSVFQNVEIVDVSLINERLERKNYNFYVSPDIELVKSMNTAFPNIRGLCLAFNVSEMTGLTCIFQNLTKLATLRLDLCGNFNNFSSDLFDSIVLDLPFITVTSLKEPGGVFKNIESDNSNDASIRNLSGKHEHPSRLKYYTAI